MYIFQAGIYINTKTHKLKGTKFLLALKLYCVSEMQYFEIESRRSRQTFFINASDRLSHC